MNNINPSEFKNHCEAGYNLLMTSIALMVIGVISVGFIQIYNIYKKNDDFTTNQVRISNIVSIIQNYKNVNGRFPCPSSLNAPRGTATAYGGENCATVIPAGTCAGGICVVNGRTIAGVPQPVRIGAIPFRLLQIDEKETYDAYGSRLLYAVTQNQTNVTTFNEVDGAINVADESGQSITDPTGTAAGNVSFSVVSHGPNRYGAYNLEGNQAIACTAGVSEASNCINMALPPAAPYTMISSLEYLTGAATNFDDTIEYFSSTIPARWRRTDAEPNNIQTISNTNVGVDVTTPAVALDIAHSAAIAAADGRQATIDGGLSASVSVNANRICDLTGNNCFEPADFTSNSGTRMNCNSTTTKRYMVGIGADTGNDHAEAKCDFIRASCPSGTVLIGFETTNKPKCVAIGSSCDTSTVQICNASLSGFDIKNSNQPKTHPTSTRCIDSTNATCTHAGTGVNNDTYTIYDPDSYASNRAYAKFKCNSGVWSYAGAVGGKCSCNPIIPTDSDCTKSPISATCSKSASCGTFASGTATVPYTYNASSCGWTAGSTNYSTCSCPATAPPEAPMPTTSSPLCTGFKTTTWTWNSNASVCDWQSSCTCTPPDVKTKTLTTDGVACNTPSPSGPGLIGYTGTAYRTQVFKSTGGVCGWQNDGWDTHDCKCDTSAPAFSEPTTSTCSTACEDETTPAYNWYKYDNTSGSCLKTLDHTTPSVCVDKTFSFKINATYAPTTGQSTYGDTPVGKACNLECKTNNTVGIGSACWQAGLGGKFDIYTCTCQEN